MTLPALGTGLKGDCLGNPVSPQGFTDFTATFWSHRGKGGGGGGGLGGSISNRQEKDFLNIVTEDTPNNMFSMLLKTLMKKQKVRQYKFEENNYATFSFNITWEEELDNHAKTSSEIICLSRHQAGQKLHELFDCFLTTNCPSGVLVWSLKQKI